MKRTHSSLLIVCLHDSWKACTPSGRHRRALALRSSYCAGSQPSRTAFAACCSASWGQRSKCPERRRAAVCLAARALPFASSSTSSCSISSKRSIRSLSGRERRASARAKIVSASRSRSVAFSAIHSSISFWGSVLPSATRSQLLFSFCRRMERFRGKLLIVVGMGGPLFVAFWRFPACGEVLESQAFPEAAARQGTSWPLSLPRQNLPVDQGRRHPQDPCRPVGRQGSRSALLFFLRSPCPGGP